MVQWREGGWVKAEERFRREGVGGRKGLLVRYCGKYGALCAQQNNMSQASHQHQHLFSKNNRLYQQLLQDDFPTPNAHPVPSAPSHAATIRFAKPSPPVLAVREPQYASDREQFSPRLPRSGGLFKGFQPSLGRMSNQATQSLSSNYCITEHENEENSTVNLYSLSRNHIEPDLDLSRSPTAHIDPDDSLPLPPHHPVPNNNAPILEASMLNNHSRLDNNPALDRAESSQLSQNIKKYRSEEYSHLPYSPEEEEEETEGKVPKVLAQKYLRNDITKKFSQGHDSDHEVQSSFKTVLNEIHVVPYRINNELKPYAYSLPVEHRQCSTQQNITLGSQADRRGKANSLNLRNSGHSGQEEAVTTPARHLYFSNHTHLTPVRPAYIAHSEAKTRPAPRSEPKYASTGNDRSNRSNSIECKSKPNISLQQEGERNPEHLEQSQVTKIFKNATQGPPEDELLPQQSSIIYESGGLNICCNLTRNGEQPSKINFLPRPREEGKQARREQVSPFFVSSIDMSKVTTLQNPKGAYKINPIQVIREMSEPESQRGIKLVGFPQRRDRQ